MADLSYLDVVRSAYEALDATIGNWASWQLASVKRNHDFRLLCCLDKGRSSLRVFQLALERHIAHYARAREFWTFQVWPKLRKALCGVARIADDKVRVFSLVLDFNHDALRPLFKCAFRPVFPIHARSPSQVSFQLEETAFSRCGSAEEVTLYSTMRMSRIFEVRRARYFTVCGGSGFSSGFGTGSSSGSLGGSGSLTGGAGSIGGSGGGGMSSPGLTGKLMARAPFQRGNSLLVEDVPLSFHAKEDICLLGGFDECQLGILRWLVPFEYVKAGVARRKVGRAGFDRPPVQQDFGCSEGVRDDAVHPGFAELDLDSFAPRFRVHSMPPILDRVKRTAGAVVPRKAALQW